jgi:hypothetical protein
MRLRNLLSLLLVAPFLAACVNDSATYEIDNTREHALSLIREQPYFWDSKVNLYLVVSRLPACMRRHSIGQGTEKTKVEIYQLPSGVIIVRADRHMFATESRTCEGFSKLDAEPPDGMGKLKGTFRVRKGELGFFKAEGESSAPGE